MNLELLDPFRRQIPDRVDSTLQMPAFLHANYYKGEANSKQYQADDDEWKASYHVAYNRRGTYVAIGYASGLVGVFDVISRTLNAIYRGDLEDQNKQNHNNAMSTPKKQEPELGNGVTSVSWSRRSRTLLAGAVGDTVVRLYDTTHPHGPEECTMSLAAFNTKESNDNDRDDEKPSNPRASPSNASQGTLGDRPFVRSSSFGNCKTSNIDYVTKPRILKTDALTFISHPGDRESPAESSQKTTIKFPALHFSFPSPIGGSLEVHPRYTTGGLAVLSDGSLVLFWIPESAWWDEKENGADGDSPSSNNKNRIKVKPKVRLWTLWSNIKSSIITCACFDPQGERIYAATKEGALLGFEIGSIFKAITSPSPQQIPPCEKKCHFTIRIPGGATVWHLLVSRDGKHIIINCADGALRLYSTKGCWQSPEEVERPNQVFQDVVNKVRFISCALSGDGEYVVGGANGVSDDKYELYIWNTSTGALMDKLTGAPVQLNSVAWHPTRSFLSVATSDGLIDVWGPRINWTAFAPDFQALPMNVEYVEREDEFDLDENGNNIEPKDERDADADDENASVDVVTVEPVPVFASDSEEEEDVFYFETKYTNTLGGRGRNSMLPGGKSGYDDG